MKKESYYTPEEEAMALRVMGDAVDYFFRDAIAHYSDRQRLAVEYLDGRYPDHKAVYKAHMLSTPVSVLSRRFSLSKRDVTRIIKIYERNRLY